MGFGGKIGTRSKVIEEMLGGKNVIMKLIKNMLFKQLGLESNNDPKEVSIKVIEEQMMLKSTKDFYLGRFAD